MTLQALALARRYLKATEQDVACLSASGRKPLEDAAEGVVADGSEAAAGVTAAAGGSEAAAAAAAAVGAEGSSGSSSQYPATCHRLVVLECKPSQPRKLLVRGPPICRMCCSQSTRALVARMPAALRWL